MCSARSSLMRIHNCVVVCFPFTGIFQSILDYHAYNVIIIIGTKAKDGQYLFFPLFFIAPTDILSVVYDE